MPTDGRTAMDAPGTGAVFATANGRARRHPRWLGRALGAMVAAWMTAILLGGSGFVHLPALGALPRNHRHHHGTVVASQRLDRDARTRDADLRRHPRVDRDRPFRSSI